MDAEKIISTFDLGSSTWTAKGAHGVLHMIFPVSQQAIILREYFGDAVETALVFVKDNYLYWCWRDADMRRIRNAFIDKVNADSSYLNKTFVNWKKKLALFDKEINRLQHLSLSELTDKEIIRAYKKFFDAYVIEYSLAVTIQDAFSMYADEFLEPAFLSFFEKRGIANGKEKYTILTTPDVQSFVNEEMKERLLLLKEVQARPSLAKSFSESFMSALEKVLEFKEVQKKFNVHAKRWFFIGNNYATQERLGSTYFIKLVHELQLKKVNPDIELARMSQRLEENKQTKHALLESVAFPPELKNLLAITETFAIMQDVRKKYMMIAVQYQRDFLDEIGKRLGIPREEMNYTIFPELEEMLLQRKCDRELLRKRRQGCMCIQTSKRIWVLDGPETTSVFERLFPASQKVLEIKGTPASLGLVVGRVKIILKKHDFVAFQQGDVLVASMTKPEYVPIMEKAAAIITDEGGVTCHAAIISRELDVPCIVGTKIATRVLKNGDLVEVDANKGIIKKL